MEVGAPLTNVSKVGGCDPFDLVEASVQVRGFLGQGRHGLDVDLLAVHRAAQAHTQQTRGQVCQQGLSTQGQLTSAWLLKVELSLVSFKIPHG